MVLLFCSKPNKLQEGSKAFILDNTSQIFFDNHYFLFFIFYSFWYYTSYTRFIKGKKIRSIMMATNILNLTVLAALIVIGVYDIWLCIQKRPTLSQRYQKLFPTFVDVAFLGIILVGLCFLWFIHPALRIWVAGIAGHICWPNKETFERK